MEKTIISLAAKRSVRPDAAWFVDSESDFRLLCVNLHSASYVELSLRL